MRRNSCSTISTGTDSFTDLGLHDKKMCTRNDSFTDHGFHDKHIKVEGFIWRVATKDSKPKSDIKCPVCDATFLSREALVKHTAGAGVPHAALWPCAACGDSCGSDTALKHHTAEKHSPEQQYCDELNGTNYPFATSYLSGGLGEQRAGVGFLLHIHVQMELQRRLARRLFNAESFAQHTRRKHLGVTGHGARRNRSPRARGSGPAPRVVCEVCGRSIQVQAACGVQHAAQHSGVTGHGARRNRSPRARGSGPAPRVVCEVQRVACNTRRNTARDGTRRAPQQEPRARGSGPAPRVVCEVCGRSIQVQAACGLQHAAQHSGVTGHGARRNRSPRARGSGPAPRVVCEVCGRSIQVQAACGVQHAAQHSGVTGHGARRNRSPRARGSGPAPRVVCEVCGRSIQVQAACGVQHAAQHSGVTGHGARRNRSPRARGSGPAPRVVCEVCGRSIQVQAACGLQHAAQHSGVTEYIIVLTYRMATLRPAPVRVTPPLKRRLQENRRKAVGRRRAYVDSTTRILYGVAALWRRDGTQRATTGVGSAVSRERRTWEKICASERSERARRFEQKRLGLFGWVQKAKAGTKRSGAERSSALAFDSEAALKFHLYTHMEQKPYACPLCPKTFAAKTAREFHVRAHTGERPYQCAECPLACALKGTLARHIARVSTGPLKRFIYQSSLSAALLATAQLSEVHLKQTRRFPCDICQKTFTERAGVKLHVRAVHSNEPARRVSNTNKQLAMRRIHLRALSVSRFNVLRFSFDEMSKGFSGEVIGESQDKAWHGAHLMSHFDEDSSILDNADLELHILGRSGLKKKKKKKILCCLQQLWTNVTISCQECQSKQVLARKSCLLTLPFQAETEVLRMV
ncbi:hypothetical protein MSG28_016140 [Choristoneura fumiferana]|uniref:Uncharacterized protein n=1 Tax=Choristoneura fumiferana TaxID=7141 RepID=A0ACC0K5I8_CHOFU|nr:hypothetical protein MSG28_016140 [Choristoneura fumiferana]